MTVVLLTIVCALVVIAAATIFGRRLGVAAPLVLVAVGVGASFVPRFATLRIDPEAILEGLLPPLLYAAAVAMPAMNFRRELGAISGLSVLLVVISSLLLGLYFGAVVGGIGFATAVALGAIISPTDAVATSIIKQTPVSKRVVALLDGESLLNDATALVVLATAVGTSFSVLGTIGSFVYSVVCAVLVGWGVGSANLFVRRRITDPTVNTLISFTVPFLASVPASLLGASGLVAAVVAGLITGIFAPRYLTPQSRLSDRTNWRTVEMVLEGVIFITMGLQIKAVVTTVQTEHAGVLSAVLVAVGALLAILLVRAAYVAPLLRLLSAWSRHGEQLQGRLSAAQTKMTTPEGTREVYDEFNARSRLRRAREPNLDRFVRRVTQVLADIDYFRREPLRGQEGVVVVWAGMRGAVTVAAAQTLPEDTPQRSVLILIAFAVATLSLVIQGSTIGPLVRRVETTQDPAAVAERDAAERERLFDLLRRASESVPKAGLPDGEVTPETYAAAKRHRLAVIRAQRDALLEARADGTFDADVLEHALNTLDASQIDLEMRGAPVD